MESNIIKANPPKQCADSGFELWSDILNKEVLDNSKLKHTESPLPTSISSNNKLKTSKTIHRGGCHCGKIRFSCEAPKHLIILDCNCSDCRMRRNSHFVIPHKDMKGILNKEMLKEYRWGTGNAKHYFCSICGISPFYKPRSNPDGYAITFAALDEGTVDSVEVRRFDGRNWEKVMSSDEGGFVSSFSKT